MGLLLSFAAWAFHRHHDIGLVGHRWVSVRILSCARYGSGSLWLRHGIWWVNWREVKRWPDCRVEASWGRLKRSALLVLHLRTLSDKSVELP
jgi:hypothetical protein